MPEAPVYKCIIYVMPVAKVTWCDIVGVSPCLVFCFLLCLWGMEAKSVHIRQVLPHHKLLVSFPTE